MEACISLADSSGETTDFNPLVSPHREDPHRFYRAARARPVTLSPTIGAYAVARHEDDLLAVLADPVTFSSAGAIPRLYDSAGAIVGRQSRRRLSPPSPVRGL